MKSGDRRGRRSREFNEVDRCDCFDWQRRSHSPTWPAPLQPRPNVRRGARVDQEILGGETVACRRVFTGLLFARPVPVTMLAFKVARHVTTVTASSCVTCTLRATPRATRKSAVAKPGATTGWLGLRTFFLGEIHRQGMSFFWGGRPRSTPVPSASLERGGSGCRDHLPSGTIRRDPFERIKIGRASCHPGGTGVRTSAISGRSQRPEVFGSPSFRLGWTARLDRHNRASGIALDIQCPRAPERLKHCHLKQRQARRPLR